MQPRKQKNYKNNTANLKNIDSCHENDRLTNNTAQNDLEKKDCLTIINHNNILDSNRPLFSIDASKPLSENDRQIIINASKPANGEDKFSQYLNEHCVSIEELQKNSLGGLLKKFNKFVKKHILFNFEHKIIGQAFLQETNFDFKNEIAKMALKEFKQMLLKQKEVSGKNLNKINSENLIENKYFKTKKANNQWETETFKEQQIYALPWGTGTGKTETLIKIAQQTIDRGERVVILVNSIAIANKIKDALGKGIHHYINLKRTSEANVEKIKSEHRHQNLVVCSASLCHPVMEEILQSGNEIENLIIDECVSTIELVCARFPHSDAQSARYNIASNCHNFYKTCKIAKKIFLADAGMTDDTLKRFSNLIQENSDELKSIDVSVVEAPTNAIRNNKKPLTLVMKELSSRTEASEITKNTYGYLLEEAVEKHKKTNKVVFIGLAVKEDCTKLKEELDSLGYGCLCISSDTRIVKEIKQFLKNPNEHVNRWNENGEVNFVIYTNQMGTGVSITEQVGACILDWSKGVIDSNTAMQMLGRCRNSEEYIVHCKSKLSFKSKNEQTFYSDMLKHIDQIPCKKLEEKLFHREKLKQEIAWRMEEFDFKTENFFQIFSQLIKEDGYELKDVYSPVIKNNKKREVTIEKNEQDEDYFVVTERPLTKKEHDEQKQKITRFQRIDKNIRMRQQAKSHNMASSKSLCEEELQNLDLNSTRSHHQLGKFLLEQITKTSMTYECNEEANEFAVRFNSSLPKHFQRSIVNYQSYIAAIGAIPKEVLSKKQEHVCFFFEKVLKELDLDTFNDIRLIHAEKFYRLLDENSDLATTAYGSLDIEGSFRDIKSGNIAKDSDLLRFFKQSMKKCLGLEYKRIGKTSVYRATAVSTNTMCRFALNSFSRQRSILHNQGKDFSKIPYEKRLYSNYTKDLSKKFKKADIMRHPKLILGFAKESIPIDIVEKNFKSFGEWHNLMHFKFKVDECLNVKAKWYVN